MNAMEFVPGTIFANDYRVRHALSAGGMGAVYVVDQISTGKARALKLMHPQLAQSAELRARFELEARIGSRIPSEHVVEVHAAGIDLGTQQPYIVMELLEGESLAARIARSPVDPATAREILSQICHAMIAAHGAGVVHRDLKPENIFLAVPHRMGATLTVKILDFGIAKIVEREAVATSAIGSPMWLAPEQTERSPVAPATDIWALGLIVFYMLTGHVFWRNASGPDASVPRLMREVVLDPIPPASARAAELGARLPDGFDGWFARCVARDLRARFPDARAAWTMLEPLLHGSSSAAGTTGSKITPGAQQFAETQPFVDVSQTDRERGATALATASAPAPPHARRGRLGVLLLGIFIGGGLVVGGLVGLGIMFSRHGHARVESSSGTVNLQGGPDGVVVEATVPPPPTAIHATPPPIPSFASSGIPGMPVLNTGHAVGGFVMADSNPTLQGDAQEKFNARLADELGKCLTDGREGSINLLAKVRPDGVVTQVVARGASGAFVNCMTKLVQDTHFVATKKGGDLVFTLFWQKK